MDTMWTLLRLALAVPPCVTGLTGCGSDTPAAPQFIAVDLGDPCRYVSCSGGGQCARDPSGGPACLCDVGYRGAYCEICDEGFHRDSKQRCVLDKRCSEQSTDPCGPHGFCFDSAGGLDLGVIQCQCNEGYEGPRCRLCARGFHAQAEGSCLEMGRVNGLPACTPDTCGGLGRCDMSEGMVRCECNEGYTGLRCHGCAPGYHRDATDACVRDELCTAQACGHHGRCDDSSGVPRCLCQDGYAGPACEQCAPGFHTNAEGACVLDQRCLETTCGAYGSCSDASGIIRCSCEPGYAGDHCQLCAAAYHRDPGGLCVPDQVCTAGACRGHGSCEDGLGIVLCRCDAGYAGQRCEACRDRFHRDAAGACVPDQFCSAASCGKHGICNDGGGVIVCICDAGFAGGTCQDCAPGFHAGTAGDCVPDEVCGPSSCPAHATCRVRAGLVECTCEAGYVGELCNRCHADYRLTQDGTCVGNTCSTWLPGCGEHGTCVDASRQPICVCDPGYRGTTCRDCEPGFHDEGGLCLRDGTCLPTTCDSHGTCLPMSGGVVCDCLPEYAGIACQLCAPGLGRAGSSCRPCTTGPLAFDDLVPHVTSPNVCIDVPMPVTRHDGFSVESLRGDGRVWSCGPSGRYPLTTAHLVLEAGPRFPARLVFDGPIHSLGFDYAARLRELRLEVFADGVPVVTFGAAKDTGGAFAHAFTSPSTTIELVSLTGQQVQFALDNLQYVLASCP
ncbi:MAG: hypothetical protein MJD61_06400 [Proteobacteria bacterium]|nr:hypothetical protein [Pseudomonadota bacterium]